MITGPAPSPVTVIFEVALPSEFSTTTCCSPVAAPLGISVTIEVEVLSVTTVLIPPISTDDPERFLPIIVIGAPVSALDGVMLLIFGPLPFAFSFKQDRLARVNKNNKEKEVSNALVDFFICLRFLMSDYLNS